MAGIDGLLKARDLVEKLGEVDFDRATDLINALDMQWVDALLRADEDEQRSMVSEWLVSLPQAPLPSAAVVSEVDTNDSSS